jgi:hypothetical protein
MAVQRVAVETKSITRKTGNVYKAADESSRRMIRKSEPVKNENSMKRFSEVVKSLAEKRAKHDITMVEHFIEENSGEYKRKAMWSCFSQLLTYKKFNDIINDLHESGKIAIDKDGKIGWIWNPDVVKKYRNREDLAFK